MRSRRTWVDVLGPLFGIAAAALTVYALVHLLWIEPFYRGDSYGTLIRPERDFRTAAGWQSREGTEEIEGSFRTLEIRNISGPILVEGWDRGYVQVHYIKRARSEVFLEQFEIRIEPQGGTLSVRPIYKKIPGSPFGSVSFDVKIPSSVERIRANNISGTIDVENVPAGIAQELETVSGRIRSERSGELAASSVSGSIDFAFRGKNLDLHSTSGRIEGRILGLEPGGSVQIDTISGGVRLEVFPALDATLKLGSVSGSISCDFPVQITEQKRNRLEGSVGEGTVPFEVKTVSGRISLDR